MPLAFPSDGPMDSYRHGSISTGGYYTNDESEVESPSITQLLEEPSIVIDPALLGDVQPRPVSRWVLGRARGALLLRDPASRDTNQPRPLPRESWADLNFWNYVGRDTR